MADLIYTIEDRMTGECICLEVDCICGGW
jgi:hypothetical protein